MIRHANHGRHTNAKNPPRDDQIANDPRHPGAAQLADDQSVNDQMNWTDGPFGDVLVNCRLTTLDWGQAFVVDASYWEDSQNLP